MASCPESVVKVLLDRFGATSAEQAGIQLDDKPAPLYELLVLATLLSARISGDIAVAAAKELFDAGYGTPQRMRQASWQDRVDALGRGGYRRYDERTSTMLDEAATLLLDRWHGDLRQLGLPSTARGLFELVDSPRDLARLSSALVHVSRSSRAADEVKQASRPRVSASRRVIRVSGVHGEHRVCLVL